MDADFDIYDDSLETEINPNQPVSVPFTKQEEELFSKQEEDSANLFDSNNIDETILPHSHSSDSAPSGEEEANETGDGMKQWEEHSPQSSDRRERDRNSSIQTALYVGNMTWWTTDQQLEDLLSEFGKLKSLRFFEDKVNGKSKGYALAEYIKPESAYVAKEKLHNKDINGRPCIVNFVSAEGLKQLGAGGGLSGGNAGNGGNGGNGGGGNRQGGRQSGALSFPVAGGSASGPIASLDYLGPIPPQIPPQNNNNRRRDDRKDLPRFKNNNNNNNNNANNNPLQHNNSKNNHNNKNFRKQAGGGGGGDRAMYNVDASGRPIQRPMRNQNNNNNNNNNRQPNYSLPSPNPQFPMFPTDLRIGPCNPLMPPQLVAQHLSPNFYADPQSYKRHIEHSPDDKDDRLRDRDRDWERDRDRDRDRDSRKRTRDEQRDDQHRDRDRDRGDRDRDRDRDRGDREEYPREPVGSSSSSSSSSAQNRRSKTKEGSSSSNMGSGPGTGSAPSRSSTRRN